MHRTLFGVALVMSVFGFLFAQTKSTDHVPDLIIWLTAVCVFIASLWIAIRRPKDDKTAVLWAALAALGVLFCAVALSGLLGHLHSL